MSLALLTTVQNSFSSEEFWYSLFLGFLPSAWDISTDVQFGSSQEEMGEELTAGLCYMFICLPLIIMLAMAMATTIQRVTSTLLNILLAVLLILLFIAITAAMCIVVGTNPTIFKYPAIICSVFVLGTKMVAVVVHTQEVKDFSRKITMAECTLESSAQLLLLLHIWLSGGQLYLGAIISSVIVIGKIPLRTSW